MGFLKNIKNVLGGSGKPRSGDRGSFSSGMKAPDGKPIVAEGPFPIATPEGRLICKNCGTTFDWATIRYVQGTYASETAPDRVCTQLCRKCSTHSVFLREDIAAVLPLAGMTSKPRNERTMGPSHHQVKVVTDGPLPIFDAGGQLLCRNCGLAFTEDAFEHWRKTIENFLDMFLKSGTIIVQCTNCKAACAFAIGNDERLRPFVKKLAATLPD